MMLFLVGFALADGLPWECPAITAPADAVVYRDTDGGLEEAWEGLYDAAYAYVDEGCAWVETSTEDAYGRPQTERRCAGDGVDVVITEMNSIEAFATYDGWTLTVAVESGPSWSRIALTRRETTETYSGMTYGRLGRLEASWEGAVDGLPDDEAFAYEDEGWAYYGGSTGGRAVETAGCSFRWSEMRSEYSIAESVTAPDHGVTVAYSYDGDVCGEYGAARASVDGVTAGLVDGDTWERDLSDADGDGYSAGACDCDDADAGANAEAREVPNDGIDQDCDGADLVDWDLDNDGHDAVEFGGADCDDGARGTYPAADDEPGDGIDQDCDGADDVNADGDGFTADGDDRPADCDDTNRVIYPGRSEVPYDGIDQDCDGVDVTDADGDGEDAIEAGGRDCDDEDADIRPDLVDLLCDGVDQDCDGADDCPSAEEDTAAEEPPAAPVEEEATGCGGGAAFLAFLPFFGIRRRR